MLTLNRYWNWLNERPESAIGDPGWLITTGRILIGFAALVVIGLLVLVMVALGPLIVAAPLLVVIMWTLGRLMVR